MSIINKINKIRNENKQRDIENNAKKISSMVFFSDLSDNSFCNDKIWTKYYLQCDEQSKDIFAKKVIENALILVREDLVKGLDNIKKFNNEETEKEEKIIKLYILETKIYLKTISNLDNKDYETGVKFYKDLLNNKFIQNEEVKELIEFAIKKFNKNEFQTTKFKIK